MRPDDRAGVRGVGAAVAEEPAGTILAAPSRPDDNAVRFAPSTASAAFAAFGAVIAVAVLRLTRRRKLAATNVAISV